MRITYDPAKRDWTLRERQLDFEDATELFAGATYDREDDRSDYGEVRIMTAGYVGGRMMIVVWTARSDGRHVISMRKANDREQARYARQISKDR